MLWSLWIWNTSHTVAISSGGVHKWVPVAHMRCFVCIFIFSSVLPRLNHDSRQVREDAWLLIGAVYVARVCASPLDVRSIDSFMAVWRVWLVKRRVDSPPYAEATPRLKGKRHPHLNWHHDKTQESLSTAIGAMLLNIPTYFVGE